MVEKGIGVKLFNIFSVVMLTITALLCVTPFLIVISASVSTEDALIMNGYSVLPQDFTWDSYRMIFKNPKVLLGAYGTTIFTTIVGSVSSTLLVALTSYPLSRKDYRWKSGVSFYLFFTMLFNGGAVSQYLLISQYLRITDTFAALIFPLLMNVWNVFLLRTFFSKISPAIIEAAKIDGAGEFRVFFAIIIPMAKTGIATIFILTVLAYWNDWYQCLMYMPLEKHITLQYYLYRILSNINELQKNGQSMAAAGGYTQIPKETVRMGICVLAAGPMIVVFMFFQKYFVKGISVGGVKG